MSEFVFILGAGASAHTGAPLMKDFFGTVCGLYEDGMISSEDKESFELVIEAKKALERILVKVDLPLDNMETLFSLIEMGRLIGGFPGTTPVEKMHNAIQRVIVRTIELKTNCHFKPDDYDAYDLLFKEIKALRGQSGLTSSSILTFNYDLAADWAIARNVGSINYCLQEKRDASPPDYKLLKLHGSFNWAKYKKNDVGGVIPIPIIKFVNEYCPPQQEPMIIRAGEPVSERLRYKNDFRIDVGSKINKLKPNYYSGIEADLIDDSPLIVPPTWSKTEYHTILRNVWSQAAKEISGARYIFVIGYSLPESDLFFQHLLALGMLDITRIRAFWVVDNGEKTIERYKKLIRAESEETFRVLQKPFDKYAVQDLHHFFEFNKLLVS